MIKLIVATLLASMAVTHPKSVVFEPTPIDTKGDFVTCIANVEVIPLVPDWEKFDVAAPFSSIEAGQMNDGDILFKSTNYLLFVIRMECK